MADAADGLGDPRTLPLASLEPAGRAPSGHVHDSDRRIRVPVQAPAPVSTAPAVGTAPPVVDAPGGDFARALETATARFDPTRLASVPLGQMVSALAGEKPAAVADAFEAARIDPLAAAAPAGGFGPASLSRASLPPGSDGARILAAGERYLGTPYLWGGTSPNTGFDCSGFVQRVFADLGVSLPRVSVDQSRAGQPVASMAEARPGDLVFWHGDGRRPNHIGIYAGEGQMLVAPRTGDVVRYQDITRTPHVIRRVG